MENSDTEKEELNKLCEEVENLKLSIQHSREAVKDASYEALTENLEPFRKLKFKLSRRLCGHLAKVTSFAWCHEGSQLLSAAQDGKLILWEGLNGNKLQMITLKTIWVNACGVSLDGGTVCSGGMDNLVTLHNLRNHSDQPIKEMSGHGGYISKCRFLNSNQILSSSGDCRSILWDATTGRIICEFEGHTKDVTSFDFNFSVTSSSHFITSSIDGTCRLWDIRMGRYTRMMEAPVEEAEINDVAIFPQAEYGFICGTEQGSCHFWDLRADQPIADYYDDEMVNPCTCLCISKSGRIFFVGYDEGVCRVYDVLLENAAAVLYEHEERISGLGISADGHALGTASWNNKVFIYTGKAEN